MGSSVNAFEQYQSAFLAATPDIKSDIQDLTVQFPTWIMDVIPFEEWTAQGNQMQELEFRGSLPQIERGFQNWKRLAENTGCTPCVDDCGYNWTTWGGTGMNRRVVSLMRREFKTEPFCVKEIQSTYEYETIFEKTIENIYTQRQHFMEYSVGWNFLSGVAKKLLVDGGGLKGNTQDPFLYRDLGTATLGVPTLGVFTRIYEQMRRRPDARPFAMQNGKPLYAISASDELMDAMFLNDANVRQDLRFSNNGEGASNILEKYNFMSTIRGMFVQAPIDYPRRFNWDADLGWVEIFPHVNNIPAEVGVFSDLNPAWESAAFEEVLIYGAAPLKIFTRSPVTTLGAGSDFGPAGNFLAEWLWVNIQTDKDPHRRSGYYSAEIEMALSAQYSGSVYGIIFPRPRAGSIVAYNPVDATLPTYTDSTNVVPAITATTTPLVLQSVINPVTGNHLLTFSVAIDAEAEDEIQLLVTSGAYVTGTVVAISEDGKSLEISLPAGISLRNCDNILAVFTDNTMGCSSLVQTTVDCRADLTGNIKVHLQNPIRAITANDVVTAYTGDGSALSMTVVSADPVHNVWVLKYTAGTGPTDDPTSATNGSEDDFNCDRGGIIKLCVPPTTDATCPACGTDPVLATEEEE